MAIVGIDMLDFWGVKKPEHQSKMKGRPIFQKTHVWAFGKSVCQNFPGWLFFQLSTPFEAFAPRESSSKQFKRHGDMDSLTSS